MLEPKVIMDIGFMAILAQATTWVGPKIARPLPPFNSPPKGGNCDFTTIRTRDCIEGHSGTNYDTVARDKLGAFHVSGSLTTLANAQQDFHTIAKTASPPNGDKSEVNS